MKTLKHMGWVMTMVMTASVLFIGEAAAYSDAYFSIGGGSTAIKFTGYGTGITGSQFVFANNISSQVYTANIPQRGGPVDDPLIEPFVGKYVSIIGSSGAFTIGSEIGSNVWNIAPQTATIKVTSSSGGAGTVYFSGAVKATSIDLTNGYIFWDLGNTGATIGDTSPTSEILSILRNSDNDIHYTLMKNMSYSNKENIFALLAGSTAGTRTGSYSADVTVVPEPGEWALMLAGLGLIGFSVYRKNTRIEFVSASDFRMS